MTQPSLFNEYIRPEKAKVSPIERRNEAKERVYQMQSEKWREAYRDFILTYARTHSDFTAEDVRTEYVKHKSLPQIESQQASGGVFARLIREGLLIRTGYKISNIYGNPLQTYSSAGR